MVEVPGSKKMTFSIYSIEGQGLPEHFVEAEVFSRKVRAVLSALKKADRVANGKGKLPHIYYVSELKTGSAEISLAEITVPLPVQHRVFSSVDTFFDCARAIHRGDFDRAASFDGLPGVLETISRGASHTFSHITFEPEAEEPLRVDQFFEKQVERFLAREELKAEAVAPTTFFRGTSYDAFDGELKAVDLRGAVWAGKLILTGSGVEIDCTIHSLSLEEVKENLNMRVWAEGRAIYSETSGLPERLEISRMRPIKQATSLQRWREKLSPGEEGGDESEWLDQ